MIDSQEKYQKLKSRLFYVYVASKFGHFAYVNEERTELIVAAFCAWDIKNGAGLAASYVGDAIVDVLGGLPVFS